MEGITTKGPGDSRWVRLVAGIAAMGEQAESIGDVALNPTA